MSRLELKIAPDLVWVAVAAIMWAASRLTPALAISQSLRAVVAVLLIAIGTGLIVASRVALRDADTTWSPAQPRTSTHLLTTGVYGLSRNPIYLGMLIVLLSWAVLLSSPLAAILSALFAIYVDRFQIEPEERILEGVFGQEYRDYKLRVRRWV